MSTSLEVDLPKRPGFGAKGRAAKIGLNSYAVTRFPTAIINQYDVTIGKGDEKRGLIKKIWFSEKVQASFGAARNTVLFDGNKLAWSVKPFPFGERLTLSVDLDEGDSRPRRTPRDNSHKVVIQKSGRVPLQVVEAFVKGQYRIDNDVLVGINFLDHLMRETPSKHYIAIKRSFFQQAGARELERGVEAWKGIFQSVRATQGGRLTINVDVATAVFWSQGTVLDTALRLLRINSPEELANKISHEGPKGPIMRDLRRMKRVSFFCKHRQRDSEVQRRSYSIEGFEQNAKEFTFELRRPNTEGGLTVTKITAFDYFLKQYNLRLKFPLLPLVKTKKKGEVFPMELAHIVEGQRYPFKLDERQTADMIKFTVQRPNVRAEQIKANVAQLDWKKDPLLKEYGMEIDTNMIKSDGRVMPVPKIAYGAGSTEPVFAPRDGKWDLRGKKFVKISGPVKGWGVMVFGHPRFCDEDTVKNFIRVFVTTYNQHGGVIETKDPPIMYADPKKAVGTNIFELYKKAGNKVNAKPQMLVFILQQKSAQPYNDIKAYCDINIGVASQCLQSKHVQQAKPQYCSNVGMKFNAKLGGATCYLDKNDHPLFGKDPSILIGADVSHASPGVVKSSFASMVGSVDLQGARFAAIANTNGYRVEVITTKNMIKFMCTLLRAFKANTGKIPMRIFYFRDGVSEGQYQHIIEQELHDMREACKVLQSDYNPKITVTICSKRHHTRFFPIDRIAQDRNGNCVPGTIVERDVTHPTEYDFYLAAHNAIQGTARPVHYHVIHDENKMPVDLFQALVYNTCYTYCRASNSVSLIPAAYYAHLASTRARAHESNTEDTMTVTTGTSGSGGRDFPPTEAPDIRPLHDGLKHAMWYV
ncbi:Protein argonaute [Maublancomyces gigas]|uniref:Protein argonaute n=1 Tax=Discina gigas TaxID=1032678 RepID=A0ABR3GQK6_9PEZI